MKAILLFLLVALSAVGQTTFNNVAVKTNATVAGADVSTKVANVAALVALSPKQDGQLVQTLGYYSAGDGGGANYRFVLGSTASTNLGTVFSVSGGRFIWVGGSEINVKMFGAKIDGVTDDTASVVSACAYAETAASGSVGSVVFFPPGTCVFSSVTITNASIRGSGSQYRSSPTVNGTVFFQTTNATSDMIIMTGDGRGSFIENVTGIGQNDYTVKNKIRITAVTGRTNYTVSAASLPTSTPNSAFPFYGPCFFYSNEGKYVGSGVVWGINSTNGNFYIYKGTDCYAYRTNGAGGLLTTNDFVVFSPAETISGIATNFPSPASAGPAFISIQGDKKKVSNVAAYFWHSGLKLGPYLLPQVNDFKSGQCTFAGIANQITGFGSDDLMDNLFLTGGPYNSASGGVAETNVWADAVYRFTMCGQWGTRAAGNYGRMVVDGAVFGVVDIGGTSPISYNSIYLDHVVRNGIQSFAVGLNALGSAWSQPTLAINQLFGTTPYQATWLNNLPTTYLTGVGSQPTPGRDLINNQAQGRVISIGTLSAQRAATAPSSAFDWGYLCSISIFAGAPFNRVLVDSVVAPGFPITQGFSTQNSGSATAWEVGNYSTSVSANAAGAGWFKISTGSGQLTGIGLALAGSEVLRYNSGGLHLGSAADNSASAILQADSTTRGFLPPRMTQAQRNAISSPQNGLQVFCTDCTATDGSTGVMQTYSSSSWRNSY